jgi:chromosomal replication initiation ATPase DnaA
MSGSSQSIVAYRLESAADVIAGVMAVTGITLTELRGRSRMLSIARRRSIAMALIRARLSMSYEEIAKHFDRDHTTVMTAVKRCDLQSMEARAVVAYLDRARAE